MTVFFVVPDQGLRQIGEWLDGHGTPQAYEREIAVLPERARAMGRFTAAPLVDFVRAWAEQTAIEKASWLLVPDDAPSYVRRLLATNGSAGEVLARHDPDLDLDLLWLGASEVARAIDALANAKERLPWTAARNADYVRAVAYALERARAADAALYIDFDARERGLTHVYDSSSFVVSIDVVSALEVKRQTRAWLASDRALALHLRSLLANPAGAQLAKSMILDYAARMARAVSPYHWQFACAHVVGASARSQVALNVRGVLERLGDPAPDMLRDILHGHQVEGPGTGSHFWFDPPLVEFGCVLNVEPSRLDDVERLRARIEADDLVRRWVPADVTAGCLEALGVAHRLRDEMFITFEDGQHPTVVPAIHRRNHRDELRAQMRWTPPKRYAPTEGFVAGDLVLHPKFGLGRVSAVDATFATVTFDEGPKRLAHRSKH